MFSNSKKVLISEKYLHVNDTTLPPIHSNCLIFLENLEPAESAKHKDSMTFGLIYNF